MTDIGLIGADTSASGRDSEDTTSGHSAERLTELLETKPYVYRNVVGIWVEDFPGYLLLSKKRFFNLDIDKQQREDFFRYAETLLKLRDKIYRFGVLKEQDKFKAKRLHPASEQLIETRQFIGREEDDSACVMPSETIEEQLGLDQLQVTYNIDRQVSALLDRPTLAAANIVTAVLSTSIAKGLPVERVDVKLLADCDAGQWQELVFTIHVDLNSQDANREWDSILDEIRTKAHRESDEMVIASLSEKIGLHFRWKVTNHV